MILILLLFAQIRISTLNVQNLDINSSGSKRLKKEWESKINSISASILNSGAHVVNLQEIINTSPRATIEALISILNQNGEKWDYVYDFTQFTTSPNFHVNAILFNRKYVHPIGVEKKQIDRENDPVKASQIDPKKPSSIKLDSNLNVRRSIVLPFMVNGVTYYDINVHFHKNKAMKDFSDLMNFLSQQPNHLNFIISGDFNLNQFDLLDILKSNEDAWLNNRYLNILLGDFQWTKHEGDRERLVIDHLIFYSGDMTQVIDGNSIFSTVHYTDHPMASFEVTTRKMTPQEALNRDPQRNIAPFLDEVESVQNLNAAEEKRRTNINAPGKSSDDSNPSEFEGILSSNTLTSESPKPLTLAQKIKNAEMARRAVQSGK
eukprot:NODE_119_length_18186_cov_1.929397.p4 type:complete len:376 gc:universal NODE_119_length_18186_cov_1.929397:14721-13594(-)